MGQETNDKSSQERTKNAVSNESCTVLTYWINTRNRIYWLVKNSKLISTKKHSNSTAHSSGLLQSSETASILELINHHSINNRLDIEFQSNNIVPQSEIISHTRLIITNM